MYKIVFFITFEFPVPTAPERLQLLKRMFQGTVVADVDEEFLNNLNGELPRFTPLNIKMLCDGAKRLCENKKSKQTVSKQHIQNALQQLKNDMQAMDIDK